MDYGFIPQRERGGGERGRELERGTYIDTPVLLKDIQRDLGANVPSVHDGCIGDNLFL